MLAADAQPAEPQMSVREAVGVAIKSALPAKTKAEVAQKIERADDDKTFRGAWAYLVKAGQIEHVGGAGKRVVVPRGP